MDPSPRAAVDETLRLIAAELSEYGFEMGAHLVLRARKGDDSWIVRTQTNKWNRRDVQAWFSLSAWYESKALAAWRKATFPGRPRNVTQFDRVAATRQIKFPGTPHQVRWDVIDSTARPAVAREAAAIIRADIIPWFEAMADPVRSLDDLLTGFSSVRSIHYALSAGHADAVKHKLASLVRSNERFAAAMTRLKADPTDRIKGNAYDDVVLFALEHSLA